MIWEFVMVQLAAFFLAVITCKLITVLLEKLLAIKKYKLTKKFSYIIAYLIIFTLGIVLGKEFLYAFL